MRQALHILWKDMRRHWPEILLVALTTGFWAWKSVETLLPEDDWISPGAAGLLGVLWLAMVARVTHGEPLVGDREFWQTRPYRWYWLLLAKFSFLALFLLGPLGIAEGWMLWDSKLPMEWIWVVLLARNMALLMCLVLMPLMTLAALTRNMVQYVLTLLGLGLVVGLSASLMQLTGLVGAGWLVDRALPLVLVVGTAGLTLWQFARRRTPQVWICLSGLVVLLIGIAFWSFTPLAYKIVYRQAGPESWPVKLVMNSAEGPGTETLHFLKPEDVRGSKGWDTVASFPVTISGVPGKGMGYLEGARVILDGAHGFHWESGWAVPGEGGNQAMLFPGSTDARLSVAADEKLLNRIPKEPVEMHVELATNEFEVVEQRSVSVGWLFTIPGIGNCMGPPVLKGVHSVRCVTAFEDANLSVWSFRQSDSTCRKDDVYDDELNLALVDLSLNPFAPVTHFSPNLENSEAIRGEQQGEICTWTKVQVGRAKPLGRVRRMEDAGQVRVQVEDLATWILVEPKTKEKRPRGAAKPQTRKKHRGRRR